MGVGAVGRGLLMLPVLFAMPACASLMISFIPTPAGWRDDSYGSPAEISNTERFELNILNVKQHRSCQGCVIAGADFSGLDLQGANFAHAILDGTDFTGANLTGASFYGAFALN